MKTIEWLTPQLHEKGWGSELWIVNNEEYCGKILRFKSGGTLSDHYHLHKDETWYVLEGRFQLRHYDLQTADRKHLTLDMGDAVHVPPGIPHQLIALEPSLILEISTPHEEDDSYRIGKGDSQK